MRRGETQKQPQQEWRLIMDVPFNGSVTNYASGSSYVMGNITGGASFAQDPTDSSRQALKVNSFGGVVSPVPNRANINYSKLVIDFYLLSNSNSYPNIIDGCGCARNDNSGYYGGIFSQLEGNTWYFSHYRCADRTYYSQYMLSVAKASIQLNKWHRLTMSLYNKSSYIEIFDIENNTVIASHTYTLPRDAYPNFDVLRIGWTDYGRYLNGYYKNFKVYEHI